MNHLGTQPLKTSRLLLRPYTQQDAPAMFQNWASDPEVTKFLMWPTHTGLSISEAVLQEWIPLYEQKTYYHWAIALRSDPVQPIGDIAVNNKIDDLLRMAHIGYCIGRKWWRQGLMSEALQAVMGYLFDEVGINRIEARYDPRNPNSGAVMKKCGMRYEGTLRQADWNNQGVCDACYYALLAEDRES